jgi:hypothetical protein
MIFFDVMVKYVFLPENTNFADVSGFVFNAKKARIPKIVISADLHREVYDNSEVSEYIVKMISLCNENEIRYALQESLIGAQNMKRINAALGGKHVH